jgi:Flp pilus assembly protein TadB
VEHADPAYGRLVTVIGWLMLAGAVALAWRSPPVGTSMSRVDDGPGPPGDGSSSGASVGRSEVIGTSRGSRSAVGALPRQRVIGVGAGIIGGSLVAVVLGGPVGVVAGIIGGAGLRRVVLRLEPGASRRVREVRAAELPVALDLLAVCLRAGSPLVAALEIVGGALPGPLGQDLVRVAGMQRLGASPGAAWSVHQGDPVLAPVVRLVRRSSASGSALADAFERLAADLRTAALAAGQARAQRAAVYATAPLGLCFLPAFVLFGPALIPVRP